jgi:hypothetical protein
MNKKLRALSSAYALTFALNVQAGSVALPADGQWHAFDVDEITANSGGLEWIDLDNETLSFDFTLASAGILTVVDAGFGGDRFRVFDNGVLLGETTAGNNTYPTGTTDFDAAYADVNFSRAVFNLAPGAHSITGLLSQSALDGVGDPINATLGAVRLSAVPIPAAWVLLLGAGGLLARFTRRRSGLDV